MIIRSAAARSPRASASLIAASADGGLGEFTSGEYDSLGKCEIGEHLLSRRWRAPIPTRRRIGKWSNSGQLTGASRRVQNLRRIRDPCIAYALRSSGADIGERDAGGDQMKAIFGLKVKVPTALSMTSTGVTNGSAILRSVKRDASTSALDWHDV